MILFEILYYTFLKFVLITPSKDEEPQHIASMTLAIFGTFNIIFVLKILRKNNILDLIKGPWTYVGIYVLFLFIIHVLFVKDGTYLEILNNYNSWNSSKKRIAYFSTFLWVLITIVLIAKKW